MKKISKYICLIITACMLYTTVPAFCAYNDMGSFTASAATVVSVNESVKVTVSDLRFRASYSTSSAIKGKAVKGQTYQLKAKTSDGKWGQISTNGYWIYLSYTTPVTAGGAATADNNIVASTEKVKVTVSDLRFRASYSTSSAIKGKAKKGETYQLKAKSKDGKWGQISTNGYWIYLSYTTPVKETAAVTPPASSSASSSSSSSVTDSNIVASTEKVKVTVSDLRFRASYSTSSAIKGKAKKGETYQLKAKTKDGKWGQVSINGYWIYLSYTTPVKETASSSGSSSASTPSAPAQSNIVTTSEYVKVTESGLRMRASYSTSSEIKGKVTKGKTYQLKAKTKDGKWGQLKSNGYWIYLSYTVPYNPSATELVNDGKAAAGVCTGQQVADYAVQFEGNPYKWGGTSLTNGADCSGFIQSVYANFGIELPRTSAQQAKIGKEVSFDNMKPGDVICYPGHVALYIGNDKIIHASTPKKGIIIAKASYRKDVKTVRRIVE